VRRAFALACAAALLFFTPAFADAHAFLFGAVPADGARVDTSPPQIVLTFDEAVETALGSLRVLDAAGNNHTDGALFHPNNDRTKVAIRVQPLIHGTYTVAWRVVSADSHLVSGDYVFGVGEPPMSMPMPGNAPMATPGINPWLVAFRIVFLAALMSATGLTCAMRMVVRGHHRPFARLEIWSWSLLAFMALAEIILNAAIAGGTFIAAASTRFGYDRLVLLLLAIAAILAVTGRRRHRKIAVVVAILACIVNSLSGHAPDGAFAPWGIAVDIIHTFAAATWIGVLYVTWRTPSAVNVHRTSTVALTCAIIVALTSVVQILRHVSPLSALFSTTYGYLIDAKTVLFIITIVFAFFARRRVAQHEGVGSVVRSELLLLAVVIIVTAALVNGVPPHPAPNLSAPTVGSKFTVQGVAVSVETAATGHDSWHVMIATTRNGKPADVDETEASVTEIDRQIGPELVAVHNIGLGTYMAEVHVPFPGDWKLTIRSRVGQFDEGQTEQLLPVPSIVPK
jgi:copper transport protein